MGIKRASLIVGICVLGSFVASMGVLVVSVNSQPSASLAPGIPAAKATPLPPPPPKHEPIETIKYLKALPTIDWSKIGTPGLGTRVLLAPTLNPTDASIQTTPWAATPIPYPTRFHVTPDGNLRQYVDPNLGFSFVYPANWFVQGYTMPNFKFDTGYSVSIRNHNDAYIKSPLPNKDEIKIEVVVLPDSAKPLAATNLLNQVQTDAQQAGWTITKLADVTIDGAPGIRWIARGERIPGGIVSFIFRVAKQGRVYQLSAYPANSEHIIEFDRMALSFAFSE